MVDVAPFRALRYDPALAGDPARTSAPAYDAVEPLDYGTHREGGPYTILELLAPRGSLRRAASLYRRWLAAGVLRPDEAPALYRYDEHELVGGVPTVQRGILAAARLGPLDGSVGFLGHERTRPQRVADRLEHVEAVPLEVTPVHAVVDDPPALLEEVLAATPPGPPLVAASDASGADHRIWALRDPALQADVAAALADRTAVIVDGHHRWERSLALRDRRRSAGALDDPAERALVYLVGRRDGPRVEAVHQLLHPLDPRALERFCAWFHVAALPGGLDELRARLPEAGALACGLVRQDGEVALLTPRDATALRTTLAAAQQDDWGDVDAAVLTHGALPAAGLDAAAERVDPGRAAAEVAAARGPAALLVLRPVPADQVLAKARQGVLLPPKTTRFVPKPRAGLVLRPLEGEP